MNPRELHAMARELPSASPGTIEEYDALRQIDIARAELDAELSGAAERKRQRKRTRRRDWR